MAYGSKTSNTSKARSAVAKISKATTKPKIGIGNAQLQTGFTPPATGIRSVQSNDENLILNRDVFNKEAFNNTVNTNFTQLDQEPPDLSFFDPNLATVNDFFNVYQNLFFEIPKFGPTNSHEYLVVESTAYTNFIENQEQIDALLEEITDLREQNLQLQLDINELLGVKTTLDQAIRQTGEAGSLEELLQAEADLGAEQSNSSSDNLTTTPGTTSAGATSAGGGGGSGGGGRPNAVAPTGLDTNTTSQTGTPLPGRPIGGSSINPSSNIY
jgi:hypothetical protein